MPPKLKTKEYKENDVTFAATIVELYLGQKGLSFLEKEQKNKKSKSFSPPKKVTDLFDTINSFSEYMKHRYSSLNYMAVPYPKPTPFEEKNIDPSPRYFEGFKTFVYALRILCIQDEAFYKDNQNYISCMEKLRNMASLFELETAGLDSEIENIVKAFTSYVFNEEIGVAPKDPQYQKINNSSKVPAASKKYHPLKNKADDNNADDNNARSQRRARSRLWKSVQVPDDSGSALRDKEIQFLPIREGELETIKKIGEGNSGDVFEARVISNMHIKKRLALPPFIFAFLADKKYWNNRVFLYGLKSTCDEMNLQPLSELLGRLIIEKPRTKMIRKLSLADIRSLSLLIAKKQIEENYTGNIRHLVRMELNKAVDLITDNQTIDKVFTTRQKAKNWSSLPSQVEITWIFLNRQLGQGKDVETLMDSLDKDFYNIYHALYITGKLACPRVAVKMSRAEKNQVTEILREAWISPDKGINSAAAFYISAKQEDSHILITPFRELGSLERVLTNDMIIDGSKMSDENLLYIIYDVARGLDGLNRRRIIHRDIAPRNILLYRDKNLQLRAEIADYGLAIKIAKGLKNIKANAENLQFPTYTTPPETYSLHITHMKSDQWQFALLVQQLLTGEQTLFPETYTREQLHEGIIQGELKPHVEVGRQTTDIQKTLAEIVNQIGAAKTADERPEWDLILDKIEACFKSKANEGLQAKPVLQRATGYGLLPSTVAKLSASRSLNDTEPYNPLAQQGRNGKQEACRHSNSFFQRQNTGAQQPQESSSTSSTPPAIR